ncbi:unnamed protein product [Periconia digitata]|uniref:DUF427 domain-containing protein n=1 Tax=Periconia digitata TaxID=1303443 RepID=A0A9W4UBE0_9PLEO|nr:unnamed protein product [Periconia digitata]
MTNAHVYAVIDSLNPALRCAMYITTSVTSCRRLLSHLKTQSSRLSPPCHFKSKQHFPRYRAFSNNMSDVDALTKLAHKLASEGPHKYEKTPRRVRGLLNGKYIFDTTSAYLVWEHSYFPHFYIPVASLSPTTTLTKTSPIQNANDTIHLGTLSTSSSSSSDPSNTRTPTVLILNIPTLPVPLLKIPPPALDQWFEEDSPLYTSHPKDPYKRITILPSSRSVKISLRSTVLASTSHPFFLHETSLPVRSYLPPTSVNWEYLRKSDTTTYCPYKGQAEYYHVQIGDEVWKDVVWYYRFPASESVEIKDLVCFYDEKVDVEVEGVEEGK